MRKLLFMSCLSHILPLLELATHTCCWGLGHHRIRLCINYTHQSMINHISLLISSCPPGQNGRHFHRRHCETHFLEWNCWNFNSNFTEICSNVNKSTLIQVMASLRTALSHYLNNSWPSLLTHICGTRGGGGELIAFGVSVVKVQMLSFTTMLMMLSSSLFKVPLTADSHHDIVVLPPVDSV